MTLLSVIAFLLFLVCGALPAPGPTPLPGYTLVPALSDEFTGDTLDASKWSTDTSGWRGRQPGLFDPSNVIVGGGMLQLWARAARRDASWPIGYDNYTTSALHSLARIRECFSEIRWRSGSSGISSSFWWHTNNGTTWTEIDVFETTGATNPAHGGAAASNLPSHVHIFELPGVAPADLPHACGCKESVAGEPPCSIGALYSLPPTQSFADGFHIAALNWTRGVVAISLDGVVVNTIASECLVEEIGLDFDRETMPGWMELPLPSTLPDVPFVVDYVRTWVVA